MIRGQKVKLEQRPIVDANLNARIHNRFDIEVVDAKTGEIKQRAQAFNVICSALWARLLTPATYFNFIHYGTGSGTPSVADTSLFAFLGYKTPYSANDVYSCELENDYVSVTRKVTLDENTANGSTLTEVGIASGSLSTTLCTHAMLQDMNGNQISIAKTSTDIINIYATVFVHFADYATGNIHFIKGRYNLFLTEFLTGIRSESNYIATNGTTQPYKVYYSLGFSGKSREDSYKPTTVIPIALSTSLSGDTANKKFTIQAERIPVGSGNLSDGLRSVVICGSDYHEVNYNNTFLQPFFALHIDDSWYPGTTITGEAIGTGDGSTKDFATDFGDVSSATIKVDGVVVSGITVDNVPLLYNYMGAYFRCVYRATRDSSLPTYGLNNVGSERGYAIYYNPYYALGISSFTTTNANVYSSNDLTTWTDLTASKSNVPAEHRNDKYWKIEPTTVWNSYAVFTAPTLTGKNIHFATAPASGAIITADYTTKTIAKDANHVFDLTVTIQLGEFTE